MFWWPTTQKTKAINIQNINSLRINYKMKKNLRLHTYSACNLSSVGNKELFKSLKGKKNNKILERWIHYKPSSLQKLTFLPPPLPIKHWFTQKPATLSSPGLKGFCWFNNNNITNCMLSKKYTSTYTSSEQMERCWLFTSPFPGFSYHAQCRN